MVKLNEAPQPILDYRQYGIYSDFQRMPPRQTRQYMLSDLDANTDLAATVIASFKRPVLLSDVLVTPDGNDSGVDDSNTSAWTVTDGSNTIVAKTYNSTNTFPNDSVQASLGSLNFTAIPAGGRVELGIVNGTTANLPPCVVEISYFDADAYPEPGWAVIATDEGTATISDGTKGVIALAASDSTEADNDEIYLVSERELFKFAADNPIVFEALVQYTEANTDAANVIVGLMDGVAADALQDDGAGPKASYSGAVLYKVDGGTAWIFETSVGSSQTTTTSDTTAGGSSYQRIKIEVRMVTSTQAEAVPYVDGVQLQDANGNLIKHTFSIGSPTEMQVVLGIKNGSANKETLNVDSAGCWQLR